MASPSPRRRCINELSPVIKQVDNTLREQYKTGDHVWVKVNMQPWWPAEVVEDKCLPELMYESQRRPIVVKYLGEDDYVRISNPKYICQYNCPMREAYKVEGLRMKTPKGKETRSIFLRALKLAEDIDKRHSGTSCSDLVKTDKSEPSVEIEKTNVKGQPKKCLFQSNSHLEDELDHPLSHIVRPEESEASMKMKKPDAPGKSRSEPEEGVDHQMSPGPTPKSDERLKQLDLQMPSLAADAVSQFTCGASVWVRLPRIPWWPAKVKEVTQTGNGPSICVVFFNEDDIEDIKDLRKIKPFNCLEKEEFFKKGMKTLKTKQKTDLFRAAYEMATSNMFDKMDLECVPLKQTFSDESCAHPVSKDHDSRVTQLTTVKRKRQADSEESLSGKRRKKHIGKSSVRIENQLNNPTRHKSLRETSVSKNTQSDQKPKCSSYSKVDPKRKKLSVCSKKLKTSNCAKTSVSQEDQLTEGDDSLPQLMKRNKTMRRQVKNSTSKFMKKKKTMKKKRCGKGDSRSEIQEEKDEELSKREDTGYSEGSSPIPYGGKLDYTEASSPIPYGSKMEYSEASSPIPYGGIMGSEKSSCLEENITQEESVEHDSLNQPTPKPPVTGSEARDLNSTTEIQQFISGDDQKREDFDPNLDVDDCYVSDSDDEDLPDVLTPSRQVTIKEKDIVWVKWKGCPVWPAFVRRLGKKKRRITKVSLTVIEPHSSIPKRLTLNYKPRTVIPYNTQESDLFMEQGNSLEPEGRERFTKAVDTVHNYMTKKILGTLRKEDMEFMECLQEEEEVCENSPPPSPVPHRMSPPASPISAPGSVDSGESLIFVGSEEPDPEITKRYEKIKERNESLVKFLKSSEVKQYLLDILREKKKSKKHFTYRYGLSKAKDSLKNPGFGPIADEEQHDDILNTMLTWYKQEAKVASDEVHDWNYVLDVWIPEGIVYALIKLKKYTPKKAWQHFEKGVYMTKKERAEVHKSILESAKRISPEDVQRYEDNLKDRMNVICQRSGLQNIIL